jgi:hypothetical protein
MAPGAPIYKTVPRTRGIYGAGEMKYFDTFKSGAAIQSSPNWIGAELDPVAQLCLFAPVTGATIQQRIGRKVYVHKIKVKGTIIQPPAASQANPIITPFCRLMLVMDTQTNASALNAEDVMSGGASSRLAVQQFQNIDNFGRFKVLKDVTYSFGDTQDTTGTAAAGDMTFNGRIIPFKWTYKFKKPLLVNFNAGASGSVASIVDNSFHIIGLATDNTPGTGENFTMSYNSRVTFKE